MKGKFPVKGVDSVSAKDPDGSGHFRMDPGEGESGRAKDVFWRIDSVRKPFYIPYIAE
jgi:hypothetical protein